MDGLTADIIDGLKAFWSGIYRKSEGGFYKRAKGDLYGLLKRPL